MPTSARSLTPVFLLTAALVAATACDRERSADPAPQEASTSALATGAEPSSPQELTPAQEAGAGQVPSTTAVAIVPGDVEGPNYHIVVPALSLPPWGQGQLELRVVGHSGFHVNLEYPWRLRIDPPSGLTVEPLEFDPTGAAVFTQQEAVFRVPVAAGDAGEYQVDGQLRFSVCSESRCDVPRRDIAWVVSVQPEQ
ncbi:MAG: hypothetical protein JW797_17270 [Bradymonadales bacterium]|nr:hypothetical protein [Bradymonadales bacterium]